MPTKFKSPEYVLKKYMWGLIPKSKLQAPYQVDSPFTHPMDGSDVYKLTWGSVLSTKMSTAECKDLLNKLCKIKRLEDGYVIIKCNSCNIMTFFSSIKNPDDF